MRRPDGIPVAQLVVDTSGGNASAAASAKGSSSSSRTIEEKPLSPSKKRAKGGPIQYDPNGMFIEPNEEACRRFLLANGWTTGLSTSLLKTLAKVPVRFVVCDDSGSMLTSDGHRRLGQKMVTCSRWAELTQSLKFHAELAETARAPTCFHLLNNAEPVLIGRHDDGGKAYQIFIDILENESPGGDTPLCGVIREIAAKISELESELRANGQKAAVIICSDGESSDGDVAEALRPLQHLPCWVVIRLCTDHEEIVKYWNNIDENLELEMDVLDDIESEAREIAANNQWLVYTEPLHRIREFGCATVKELDLIDESALNAEQMGVVVELLLGGSDTLPHPEVDFDKFIRVVEARLRATPAEYCTIERKSKPPVSIRGLRARFGQGSGSSQTCALS